VTKPIQPIHYNVVSPLFAIIYFCCIACFRLADRRLESESLENFQDLNFEDLEQQQAGYPGKCS
jgi:hypothetical protein